MARLLMAVAAICLMLTGQADAHRLSLFASATGPEISGQAYFKGGTPARDVAIHITGPDGQALGETTTDAEGRFGFTASRRVDHLFTAEIADGHQAVFTVTAAELPESLPGPVGTAHPKMMDGKAPPPAPEPVPATEISRQVEDAVARQLRPLREQINALEDQTRLRDVIGGVGYIVGLAGLVAWLGARRKGRKK